MQILTGGPNAAERPSCAARANDAARSASPMSEATIDRGPVLLYRIFAVAGLQAFVARVRFFLVAFTGVLCSS